MTLQNESSRSEDAPQDAEMQEEGGAPERGAAPQEQGWARRGQVNMVSVETGRGNAVTVPVGSPFAETVEHIAQEANYGGYFRVFLNGEEILDPNEAPKNIEEGMRISLISYDKVGVR